MHATYSCALKRSLACHILFPWRPMRRFARRPSRTTRRRSSRSNRAAKKPVSTKTLAERLGITPGSVSAMLKRLDELGLITHVPYRGVRLTRAGPAHRARGDPPPPPARELPRRGARHAVGSRPRRGRGARARALRRPGGTDRGQARQPHRRPARRSDPDGRVRPRRGRDGRARRAADRRRRALRARVGLRPGDAALPRRAGRLARRELEVVERQPFGGPLFVRFGERTLALGDALTRAMRVELPGGGA